MTFTLTSAGGVSYSDGYTSDTTTQRIILLSRQLESIEENRSTVKFLAGDTMYIINTKKMRRRVRFEIIAPKNETINYLKAEQVDANLITITGVIDAGDAAQDFKLAKFVGGVLTLRDPVGYIIRISPSIYGKRFKAVVEMVVR